MKSRLITTKAKFYCLFFLTLGFQVHSLTAQNDCLSTLTGSKFCLANSSKNIVLFYLNNPSNSKSAEDWLNPLYNKLVAKADMLDAMIDAEVYLLIDQANESMAKNMKSKLDAFLKEWEIKDILIFQNQTIIPFSMAKGANPAMFVYASDDKSIKFITGGKYSEDKLNDLEEYLLDH